MGHARAIAASPDAEAIAREIIANDWTVRQAEARVRAGKPDRVTKAKPANAGRCRSRRARAPARRFARPQGPRRPQRDRRNGDAALQQPRSARHGLPAANWRADLANPDWREALRSAPRRAARAIAVSSSPSAAVPGAPEKISWVSSAATLSPTCARRSALHRDSIAWIIALSFQNKALPADVMTASRRSPCSTRARIGASWSTRRWSARTIGIASLPAGDIRPSSSASAPSSPASAMSPTRSALPSDESAPSSSTMSWVKLARAGGGRAGVERVFDHFLRGDRLVVGRGRGDPRGNVGRDPQALAAAEVDHHPVGIAAFGNVGDMGKRGGVALGQLQQRGRFAQRPGNGDGRSSRPPGASSRASTAAMISSPAGSIQIARGPPNNAIAPASSVSAAGSDFERAAGDDEFLRLAEPRQQSLAKRSRSWLRRHRGTGRNGWRVAGLSSAAPMPPLAAFMAWRSWLGGVRAANVARRATIWSATTVARRSTALCSAATVAYSELTTSIPASDPAVASSTTAPVASSTSR